MENNEGSRKMKERPDCSLCGKKNSGFVFMLNRFFCGECITKWNIRGEEEQFKKMQEILK
jgi:hypothetical protein